MVKTLVYVFFIVKLGLLANTAMAQQAKPAEPGATSRTLTLHDVRQKYASAASMFVDIEGINVHYRDEGKGPVLLLVHGTLGDVMDWDGWVQELKSDFRIIRFDIPGFGLSGQIPNNNYSIERMKVLIDGLMDYLVIDRFAMVGISYGGLVTFRYAATRTDRVSSMILINSAGVQYGKKVKSKQDNNDKPKKNMFVEPVVTSKDVETFYEAYINDPAKRTATFIQRKLDFMNIVGRDSEAKQAYAFYERNDPFRVLAHVRAPSLVMWGAGNKALDTQTASLFIDALKNACTTQLVTFDQGGHYINVERPEDTANAAKAFLLGLKNNPPASCKAAH